MFVIFLTGVFYGQEIEVTNPKGGEKFCRGDTITITWDSDRDLRDAKIKIRLFLYGNQVHNIATDIANTGSYDWPIPDSISSSFHYEIRVKAIGLPHRDDSERFQISLCNYPDLVVKGARVEPKPRYMGNEITYKAKIINAKTHGLAALAVTSKAQLKIFKPQGLSTLTVPLQVKAFSTFNKIPDTLKYRFVPQTYGIYKFELTLDVDNVVTEGKGENNNVDTSYFAVNPVADLIVCLTCGKRPGACKTTTIIAWVRNIGTASSPPSTLHFYVKERGTTTHPVPRLEPNEMVQFTRSAKYCDPRHFGWKSMGAHIDKDNRVREISNDNNYVHTRYQVAREPGYGFCQCLNEYKSPHQLGFTCTGQLAVECCSVKKNQ